jgi:hypothetical protein
VTRAGTVGCDEGRDLDALALRFRRQKLDHAFDQRSNVERLGRKVDPAGLDLREVEDLVDQGQERLARGLDRADIGRLLGSRRGVEQKVGHAEDAVQRRAELVTDGREEARLRLACGLGANARLLELALRRDALGDVAPGAHELGGAAVPGHGGLDPGQPAHARLRLDRLVDDARAVVADPRQPALDDGRPLLGADQALGRAAHELGEALVGKGDAPGTVALDDKIELRLDEAAVALL